VKPALCGRAGQQACTVVVRIPSCDLDLVEKVGVCERPGTSTGSTAPAPTPTTTPSSPSTPPPGHGKKKPR
jgi:hypothetical protein